MSTRRRLSRLEAGGSTAAPDHLHLVRLLGLVDGLIFPPRYTDNYTSEVVARRDYFRDGVTFTVGDVLASDEALWKRSERVRQAMAVEGWITLGQRAKVKLTTAGDTLARKLVGLPSLDDTPVLLAFHMLTEKFTCESVLFGKQFRDSRDWQEFTEIVLPLIACGAVESISNTAAAVHYRVVGPLPEGGPIGPSSLDYNEQHSTEYTEAFCQSIRERQNRPVGGEVAIPMPGSL